MKKIVLATKNKGKIREFKEALQTIGWEGIALSDVAEVKEPEETGSTFMDNARLKAKYYVKKVGLPCLADDSGLSVDALGGAPGVFSARYAGENASDDANNEKLRKALASLSLEERGARYVCALALVFPGGREVTAEAYCEGLIQDSYKGDGGFGYDPLFYLPSYGKTMAQISLEEKNSISHRGRALKQLMERLKQE